MIRATKAMLRRQYVDEALRIPDTVTPHKTSSPARENRRAAELKEQFSKEVEPQYDALKRRWDTVNASIAESYAAFSLCDRCYSRWRESLNHSGLWSVTPSSRDRERNAPPTAGRWWRRSSSASDKNGGEPAKSETTPAKAAGAVVAKEQSPYAGDDNECAKVHVRADCGEARYTEAFLIALLKEREAIIQQIEKVLHRAHVNPASAQASTSLHSLIGEEGLFRSAEAYAVVSADDSLWTEKFDDSRALAYFGDVNVALKMETRGSFTVKGLSFDPSEIARVASRVVTQTLVAAAQPATLAVLPRSRQVATEETGDPVVEIGERERHRRDALLSIANAVIEEDAAFKDSGASDQSTIDAVESISRTWSALKPLVLLEPAKSVEADVVGIVPDKMLLAPGQSAQLLIALSRKPTEEVALLVESNDKKVVEVTTNSPVKIAAEAQSKVIEIKAQNPAFGSGKISASDAEGHSKDTLACVLPILDIPQVPLAGPSEQEVTIALQDFNKSAFQAPSDIKVTVSNAGADVKTSDSVTIPKGQASAKLKVSPRQSGDATITVSLALADCPARVTSQKFSIAQSPLTLTCPQTLEIGRDGECIVTVLQDPPNGLKLIPSSDAEGVTIPDATPLNPAAKDDADHLKFKIHGAKTGKATLKVTSSLSIFADATSGVEVKEPAANPAPVSNQ
jgi:hypothetical protein